MKEERRAQAAVRFLPSSFILLTLACSHARPPLLRVHLVSPRRQCPGRPALGGVAASRAGALRRPAGSRRHAESARRARPREPLPDLPRRRRTARQRRPRHRHPRRAGSQRSPHRPVQPAQCRQPVGGQGSARVQGTRPQRPHPRRDDRRRAECRRSGQSARRHPARGGVFRPRASFRHGATRRHLDWTARTEPLAADLRPGGMRAEGFVSAEAYREHLAAEQRAPRG